MDSSQQALQTNGKLLSNLNEFCVICEIMDSSLQIS